MNLYEFDEILNELDGLFGMKDPLMVAEIWKEKLQQAANNDEKLDTEKKEEESGTLMLIPYRGSRLAHKKRVKRRRLDFDVEEHKYDADETLEEMNKKRQHVTNNIEENVATPRISKKKVPLMLTPYVGSPLAHQKRAKSRRLDFDVTEDRYDHDETLDLDETAGVETKNTQENSGKRLRADV